MMSTALLSAAVVFSGGRLERAIRGLFIASFVLALGFFVGLSWLKYDIVAFEVAILTINWIVLIIGFVVSFIVALGVVEWFLHWVRKHGFTMFAIYRIILGMALLLWGTKYIGG